MVLNAQQSFFFRARSSFEVIPLIYLTFRLTMGPRENNLRHTQTLVRALFMPRLAGPQRLSRSSRQSLPTT